MPLKRDIVESMHKTMPHHLKRDLFDIVDVILETMTMALAQGKRIEIRGFGSLYVRGQKGKVFRNPKTGQIHQVPPRRRVIFRAGKDLRSL